MSQILGTHQLLKMQLHKLLPMVKVMFTHKCFQSMAVKITIQGNGE